MTPRKWMPILGIMIVLLAVCALPASAQEAADPGVLRIATTTSLYDTGLLNELEDMYTRTYLM